MSARQGRWNRASWQLAAWAALSLAAGCATPSQQADRLASRHGFTRQVLRGEGFAHLVYRNDAEVAPGRALHIYIEGDGTPYLNRLTIAADPTPRNPLMLELMALDQAPAVYIGRPCYFGLASSADCSPVHWTIGRFGEDIVHSMATVVDAIRLETKARDVVLMGHSGGASIAVLLAPRLSNVTGLVTLGGNLDTAAWTELHGYAPLRLSLNPITANVTNVPTILHLVGALDRVTPPALVMEAALQLGPGDVRVEPGVRHTCCWEDVWPSVLAMLSSAPTLSVDGSD